MAKTSNTSIKAARKQVEQKLKTSLAPLEPIIGSKDFKRRLKNAGKALLKGLKNKKSQLALANLQQLDLSKVKQHAKKNGMRNQTSQIVTSPKKKAVDIEPA